MANRETQGEPTIASPPLGSGSYVSLHDGEGVPTRIAKALRDPIGSQLELERMQFGSVLDVNPAGIEDGMCGYRFVSQFVLANYFHAAF
jgi:hypothetical protein